MLKYKHILIILNILCALIIIQIQFNIIYINPFDFNNELVSKINQLIFIFSTGFILSSLFHLIVNIIPNNKNRKITESIVENRLKSIGSDIQFMIEYILERNELDIANVTKNRDVVLKLPSDKTVTFEYILAPKNEQSFSFDYAHIKEKELLSNIKTAIIKDADFILNLPFISSLDFSLIKLISLIQDSGFLKYIEFSRLEVTLLAKEFSKHFKKLVSFYKELDEIIEISKVKVKNIKEI